MAIISPVIPVQGPPRGPDAQNIGDQIRDNIRQAMQAAAEAQREAEQAVGGGTAGAKMAMEIIRAEITAEKANIEALTKQLVPGLSEARQEAISDQLSSSTDHLQALQEQLSNVINSQVPGANRIEVPPPLPDPFPRQAVDLSIAFFITVAVIAIGRPIAGAIGRWMDRRGQTSAAPSNLEPRFDRVEQAIEAIAIEVERVSEGQRYANKLMGELRALPAPNAAEQWPQGRKEGVAVPVERGRQG